MIEDFARLAALRKRLFEMIKAELEIDPYCKSSPRDKARLSVRVEA